MAAKVKSLKSLIGKQVEIMWRYEDKERGPFLVTGVDPPFLGLVIAGEEIWVNTRIVEIIKEIVPDA